MKEKIDLFIELSLQQCKKDDYGNPESVRIHNKAVGKLSVLKTQINITESKEEFKTLLLHNDSRVKINAAEFCLEQQILIDNARNSLQEVLDTETDSTLIFSAKQLLKQNIN